MPLHIRVATDLRVIINRHKLLYTNNPSVVQEGYHSD